ncbi:MAG: protein kinase [Desulfobulbus sp.]|jgi:serine/threonine-protein kinase|uniref:serine/threonine-protein kinase n=1 Tax=Desulfobulbus sp. TaxID=895 RepID=UPI00284E3BFD|nr:protein kinase [Desulfobulbus sp.]MDR2551297.1 protein kinase [Desulfobulbus sp.]
MMLHDAPTLVDPSVDDCPPVVAGNDGLIAGRYSLSQPLGGGGMGSVYLATDLVLARQVAVKTIRAELSGSEEVRARIKRECRLQAAIGTHPHIVTLYDTVEENGHIYLVMEYIDGETLSARLAAAGSRGLPLATALDIVRQILQALACIHDRDIVHRDIKTANILLRLQPDGRYQAKLTDFGIARAEEESEAMTRLTTLGVQGPGTPAYMAPERIDSQAFGPVCPATDLYAVGVILYELLAGQPPFTGTMTEIFSGHLVLPPAMAALPAHLPERLRLILATALAKQPADRYRDAAEFAAALDGLDRTTIDLPPHRAQAEPTVLALAGESSAAARPEATVLNPALGRARTRLSRLPVPPRRLAYAALALAVLALGGLLLFAPSSPVQPTAVAVVPPATAVPARPMATAVAVEPPPTPQPEAVSALEMVEQMRQQNNAGTSALAAPQAGEAGPPARPSPPVRARAGEWQVTEDRTRKIY